MKIKSLFTIKRVIYVLIAIIIIAIGGFIWQKNSAPEQETLTLHPADFLQQVSVSGKIVAAQNIDMSFEQAGQVVAVKVKEGDKVLKDQLLASQNTGELVAQVSQMQAGIDLEQAKLDQLLSGTASEDIKTSVDAVISAKQNLANAYTGSLATLGNAYTVIYNAYTLSANLQRNYFSASDQEGIQVQTNKDIINSSMLDAKTAIDALKISPSNDDIDKAIVSIITDLNNTYGSLEVIRQQCEEGVYYSRVLATDKASLDTQKTNVNTSLSNTITLQSSIVSYKTALLQAQDALSVKKAPPRPTDIAVYQAQIQQAKASKQNVLAQLRKKQIFSPIDGIVTTVNAKVGSTFSANDVAISVMSASNFQIESYVPEINIALIKVDDSAQVTLDAYGQDTVFDAKVISINPAETVKDGVSSYKVTLEFIDNTDSRIKSGMTGNIVITTQKKSGVISVPQGIVVDKDGTKFVKVKNGDAVSDRQIETGSVSSSGNIEVVSGLQDGDTVIIK